MTPTPPGVVLDTNVSLDWLWFADARVQPLAAAIDARRVRWLACASMRAELQHVLTRGTWPAAAQQAGALLARFDACAVACAEPAPASLATPRCRDASDQVFVELALAEGAAALLTRDRALLALRRPLARRGVAVLTPDQWCAWHASPAAG